MDSTTTYQDYSKTKANFVPYCTLDRQWDARFNLGGNPGDLATDTYLASIEAAIKHEFDEGKMRYALVGGIELGEKPYQGDYKCHHVHVALIFGNRVSKSAILKNLGIIGSYGYYLVPRNRNLPYSGWKNHHSKEESKINPTSRIRLELGELPKDVVEKQFVKRSDEEKKRKLDDILIEMRGMLDKGQDEDAFKKFPRNYLQYGEKIKALLLQKRDAFLANGDPHIWLQGTPGSGKSAILQVVYPDYYNKSLQNRFFDLYDPKVHKHMLLQDVDYDTVERLGVQFLKTICDEAGFPIDQKYKSPQMTRTVVLVSSNFTIADVVPEDMKGRQEQLRALMRRFYQVNVKNFLMILGVQLQSKFDITGLKKAGNTDPRKCFLSWDYARDCPTGEPLKTAEEYQEIVRNAYYGK